MGYELVPYGKGKGKGTVDDPKARASKKTIDYGSNVVRWLEDCMARQATPPRLQCHYSFTKELTLPFAAPLNPYDAICCRFVHSATNRNRAPVNVVHWFPNGRRLISGSQTGEITIWNGSCFQFENILQAHNSAVKAMEWTPEETVLVSGDQLGVIKFWDQYMYNFQTFQAHKESMCDISIAPTGLKFCSCAEDSHAKVWDLRTGEEERAFTGHGWDVKCCSWHPTKGLVATGSKDAQIKLWDPRAGEAITTIFSHKNTVTRVKWSPSGQFLASGSRDQLVMLMDIRTMSVRQVFKAHEKEVTSLCWHPENDSLLASGGYDSQINFWDTQGSSKPIKSLTGAHEGPIWSLAWHPLGHLLVSGSHDYSTRFWSRARPGDKDFEQLLPKKIAAPGDLPAGSIPPAPTVPQVVLDAGIFAGKPPKEPPASSIIMEGAKDPARLALDNEPAKPAPGLSLGEGADRKEILDTSDFDALEEPSDGAKAPAPAVATVKATKAAESEVTTPVAKAVGSKEAAEGTEASASNAPATSITKAEAPKEKAFTKATAKATSSEAPAAKAFSKAAPSSPPMKAATDAAEVKAAAEATSSEVPPAKAFSKAAPDSPLVEAATDVAEVKATAEDSSSGEKRAAPNAEAGESTEADAKKQRTAEEAENKDS